MLSLRRTRKADRESEAHASLLRILTIIVPTLQTLALHVQLNWAKLSFLPSLPALVRLSIQHPFVDGCLHGETFDCLYSAPLLQRLVLAGFRQVPHTTGVVASISRFAPSLTYLGVEARLSPTSMSLLVCLMGAVALMFGNTWEDLVIEDALMGHPRTQVKKPG